MKYSFFKYVFTSWVADDILNTDSGSSCAEVPEPKVDPFCVSNPSAIKKQIYQIRYFILVKLEFSRAMQITVLGMQSLKYSFLTNILLIRWGAKIKSFCRYTLVNLLEGFYISAGTSIRYTRVSSLYSWGKALLMVEYFVSGSTSKASNGLEIWIQIRVIAV